MILIDGKAVAAGIRAEIKTEVEELAAHFGRAPGLAVILAGDDPASQVYVRGKEKACAEVGCLSEVFRLPANVTQEKLEKLIDRLNARADLDGILLQLPLPAGLNGRICLERIEPNKDVDGFHPLNMGKLNLGLPGFRPCTPAGVMALLKRYGLSPAGKKSVVVGRSNIVGRPLAMMLSADNTNANATVTLCHSRTPELAEECARADFLFLALGKPHYIKADMVKTGAVVIDVGITRTENGLKGDCDFAGVKDKAGAITPVPGGVGPMTIAMLLLNTLLSFKLKNGLKADLNKYGVV